MTGKLILPDLHVARRRPLNLAPVDEGLFSHEYEKEIPGSAADILKNVTMLSNGILLGNFHVLKQSFAAQKTSIPKYLRAARAVAKAARSLRLHEHRALVATDEFSNGFFHWMCDVLPRLEALTLMDPAELKSRVLVVPSVAHFPYVSQTLAGYETGGVRILKDRETLLCHDLMVVPPAAPTGNYRPDLMQSIRGRFRASAAVPEGRRHIYISRLHAPRRKVRNEEDLLPVLDRYGFDRVIAEDLSFEEQVRLIGSASVLVGNHGAGLTHMLWMKPRASVVELRRRSDGQNNCYFSLASALDLNYYYLLCDAGNPREDAHQADVIVDPAALDMVLAAALRADGAR